jgi:hypothetical protein
LRGECGARGVTVGMLGECVVFLGHMGRDKFRIWRNGKGINQLKLDGNVRKRGQIVATTKCRRLINEWLKVTLTLMFTEELLTDSHSHGPGEDTEGSTKDTKHSGVMQGASA